MNAAQVAQVGVAQLVPGAAPRKRMSFDEEMDYGHPEVVDETRVLDNPRSSQLVDKAQQEFEMNVYASRNQHFAGQERWQGRKNEEMRLVNPLSWMGFIDRLQRAGVDARREWSPSARLWMNDRGRKGRLGISAWVTEKIPVIHNGVQTELRWGARRQQTVTSLMFPSFSPEWTIMRFNEYNVPTNERYRGWRTALLHLIAAEVIAEAEAHRAFGRPDCEAAQFYLEQLQGLRAERMGLRI